MSRSEKRPALAVVIYFAVTFLLEMYFTFAAVQGDFGLFRRVEIKADEHDLRALLTHIEEQVARMENLTLILSDAYLDLDLPVQQARDILAMLRADENAFR